MGTFITLVVVVGLVGLAVRSMIKDKKSGKGSCGGNCGQCKGTLRLTGQGIIIRR